MYSTVKELHVAIISRLYQINSERKATFKPEELDYYFNDTMLSFIEERSIILPSPNGLFETVKRYDDLRDLNETQKVNVNIINDNIYCILPSDYYKFQELQLHLNYDCFRKLDEVKTQDKQISYYVLKFDDATIANEYDTFKIEDIVNTTTLYKSSDYNMTDFTNVKSKFMIVNSILENFKRDNGFDIYWENYGDLHFSNSFIIIQDYNYLNNHYSITVGSNVIFSTGANLNVKEFDYIDPVTLKPDVNLISPTELVATKHFNVIKQNYYLYKNRHTKPLIQLTKNRIKVDYNPKYVPLFGMLDYIKRPILINYKSNIMTDFTSHISEIIDLTVTKLNLILNGSTEATLNITQTNKQY